LAQVVRLLALARSVAAEHEVHFACARFDPAIFAAQEPFQRWPLLSIAASKADFAVRFGLPIYSYKTLRAYLADDLRLIDQVRPDLIVGDLRWSLAVSGPLSKVPVASLANAYWSPHAIRDFPLPEHPLVKLLGVKLAGEHFRKALPLAFRLFARPLNRLRQRHGLPPLGSLPEVLTWGDHTLFADPPALFPLRQLPAHHHFLGPIHWSTGAGPQVKSSRLAYVTLGSSGNLRALPAVLEALHGFDVLLATAGRKMPRLPANVRAEAYVRGDLACRQAALVVCNGGASTAYQALCAGAPLVGLPMNLDQYLAMEAIERANAGVLVRSGTATPRLVQAAIERALAQPGARSQANELTATLQFRRFIDNHA
jgi:UDP:flavonoid glycosyltransferase YjiC (YdhE family)